MDKANVVKLDGREYVILERTEYDRLTELAKAAEMPALPEPDSHGNFPAVGYIRASIARDIVRQRIKLALSPRDLARLAGVRVETLCRIETGRHTASRATVAKLDRARRRAESVKKPRKTPRRCRNAS